MLWIPVDVAAGSGVKNRLLSTQSYNVSVLLGRSKSDLECILMGFNGMLGNVSRP